MTDAPRSYPDLHEHLDALEQRGLLRRIDGRSTRTPNCTRWCAGSSSAASTRPSARPSCSPTSPTAAAASIACRSWSARSPPTARSTASACGAPVDEIQAKWDHAIANPIAPRVVNEAVCQEVVIEGAALQGRGQRARPAADPDLDAGLRQRADADRDQRDHARSRDRRAEHGHLPRRAEGAGPAGGAHGDARRRRRRLPALSQAPETRRQDRCRARSCSAARPTSRSWGRRSCRSASTRSRSRAGSPAGRSTW